jgi:hypothetical protein
MVNGIVEKNENGTNTMNITVTMVLERRPLLSLWRRRPRLKFYGMSSKPGREASASPRRLRMALRLIRNRQAGNPNLFVSGAISNPLALIKSDGFQTYAWPPGYLSDG